MKIQRRFEKILAKYSGKSTVSNHEAKDEKQLNQSTSSNSSTLIQVILDMPSATSSDFHGWVEPSPWQAV